MRTSTLDVLKLSRVPQWELTLPEALQLFQPRFACVDFGATHCAPAVRPAALSCAARAGVLFSSIYSDFCSEILSPPVPTLAGLETGAGLASYWRKEGCLYKPSSLRLLPQLVKRRVSQPLPGSSGEFWPLPPASPALLRRL